MSWLPLLPALFAAVLAQTCPDLLSAASSEAAAALVGDVHLKAADE